jgi:predicted phage tail protein
MATVQQNSEAIVDLEGGAQAMWTVKAQAGDISAGIGLIADQATGKSQVLVNASQFFVFDNSVGKTAIFAIDQGQVIIRDAVIRKATIDILNAQTITATNVKAGTGAFGLGGSYMAFNETWHTLISSNGDLRTDRLYAEGGWLRNMTVEENCDVKGTIYANKIEGDVMRVWSIDAAGVSSSAERLVSTFDLTPYARGRRITPISTLTWFAVKITTQTGYVVKNYDSYRLESDVPAGTSRLYAYLRNTGYTGAVLIYL